MHTRRATKLFAMESKNAIALTVTGVLSGHGKEAGMTHGKVIPWKKVQNDCM